MQSVFRYGTRQCWRITIVFALMSGAGTLSGSGIGAGALEFIVMDQAMRIPFEVSTTTSNI